MEIHRRPGAGGALRLGDRVEFLVQEDLGGGLCAVEVRRLVYARPELLIAGIVGLHVLFWTLMPLLVHRNAPLDVIEGAVWGREWQLGYPKGPPLVPWMFGALDPLEDELRLAAVYVTCEPRLANDKAQRLPLVRIAPRGR